MALCLGVNSPRFLLETREQPPISLCATLETLLTNEVGLVLFSVTLASPRLYLVASTGEASALGRIAIRPTFVPAGTRSPFPCLIKLVVISPLRTVVSAVGAFRFPCLVLLGTLLPLVALTVVRRALLAQVPGGVAKRLAIVVPIWPKSRFLAKLGRVVGLVLLLGLLPREVWKTWLTLPYFRDSIRWFPVAKARLL